MGLKTAGTYHHHTGFVGGDGKDGACGDRVIVRLEVKVRGAADLGGDQ